MAHFIPPQLYASENAWHNVELWKSTHYTSRDNAFIADIGANGTGKTSLALRQSEILGMNEKGEQTLFNPNYLWEHVVFEKDELVRLIDQLNRLPAFKVRGYCIIVDEVQDALSSKEAMQEEVRAISSYLATLRSRRYVIHFTLPSWNMLVKDARRIMNFCNMMTRRPTTVAYSDLRIVKTDRFSDDPYLWRPRRMGKILDPWTEMSIYQKQKWKALTWTYPSPKTMRAYRKLKIEAQIKKGQKLKERMSKGMEDSEQEKQEKMEKYRTWVLSKFDDPMKVQLMIYNKRGVDCVSRAKVARLLKIDSKSKSVDDAFAILNDAYPEIMNGTVY